MKKKIKRRVKRRIKLRHKCHNKWKIIGIIISVLFIIWLIIKIIMVNAYNSISTVDEFFKAYHNKVYYDINNTYKGNDLISYKNIKFKNIMDKSFKPDDIDLIQEDGFSRRYYSSSLNSALTVSNSYSYTEIFTEEITYYSEDRLFMFFNNKDDVRKRILEKNDISNDIDLFRYMNDINNTKVSIFTPIYKIEELASVKLFASVVLPSVDELVILDGDYEGYCLMDNHIKEIVIFKDGETYFITLFGKNFKYNDYEELLSSLVIE